MPKYYDFGAPKMLFKSVFKDTRFQYFFWGNTSRHSVLCYFFFVNTFVKSSFMSCFVAPALCLLDAEKRGFFAPFWGVFVFTPRSGQGLPVTYFFSVFSSILLREVASCAVSW